MTDAPRQPGRHQLDRTFFWTGIASGLLCVVGMIASWSSTLVAWRTAGTYLLVNRSSLQFAWYYPGSVAVDKNGVPTNFVGTPPIWTTWIPLWVPLVAAITLTLIAWRWPRRPSAGQCPACGFVRQCPQCGYSVEGLPESVIACPECGAPFRYPGQHGHVAAPSSGPPAAHRGKWRPSRVLFWAGALACVLIATVMIRCRNTPRLVWLTTHTYCVCKYDVVQLALFHGPPDGVSLDRRGVPESFRNRQPIWSTQLPLWVLLAFASPLTITAWFWGRRRWLGPCPKCDRAKSTPD